MIGLLLGALALGCGSPCDQALQPVSAATGDDATFDGYDPAACAPDEAAWFMAVEPVVRARCGSCHGAEPTFGAPDDLTAYDDLLVGEPGNRLVDRMARRAALQTMPPPNSPALSHDELDLLVGWATCGEVHPDPTIGLEADAPAYTAEVPENASLPSFDLVSPGFEVAPDTLDHYQCFLLELPLDEERFIKRMQVSLDDARVLHHVVLHIDRTGETGGEGAFDCEDGGGIDRSTQIWAWAPGTGAFDFEEGGLRIEPGDRAVLEIHYNNAAGLEVVDHSGVRVFHGPVEDTEWTLAALGPEEFEVPQGERRLRQLEVFATRRLLAGMPHMHELGAEFQAWIERADGSRQDLVNLTGWNFEAQLFYRYDALLYEGDRVWTRCGFRNDTGQDAHSGLRTSDEMCFDFAFVGPP